MITVVALRSVSKFGQGIVRDLRVRWALEEAGLPHRTRLLDQDDRDKPDYRAMQPFGESGAIVLHIGERSEVLLPKDPAARARATQWLIAALNSVEPSILNFIAADRSSEEWAKLRRPSAVEVVRKRLSSLSKSLGDKPYPDGKQFTAGDLMMAAVLRFLRHTETVTGDKRLTSYIERCTARPTFTRALDAQLGDFQKAA